MGIFNNPRFASSNLSYSYFLKKCHNYDTFTLAIGLIILTFQHLINVLSNWKFVTRFLPDLVGICNFSRKILYLKLVSAIFYQIFISHQMIAYQKLWKMFFISSKKFFSFLRYSNFCISVFPSFFPCQPLL